MSNRPGRSFAAVASAAVVLAALAGCGDDAADSDAESTTSAEESPSDGDGTSAPADPSTPPVGPEVEVLDAGSEPRTLLELEVEEGQVERSTMELVMGTSVGGSPLVELPMTMTFSTTIEDVTEDEISVSYAYADIEADLPPGSGAAAKAQFEEMAAALERVTGTGRLSPSNASISTELDLPDDTPPAIAALLDQFAGQSTNLTVPFPAEPVGEGASWEVETEVTVGGFTTTQVGTYTLESLDGDAYRISVRQVQTPEAGDAGGYTVVSGSTTAAGSYEGTLRSIAAISGSISGEGSTVFESGGREVESRTSISMELTTEVE